MNEVNIKESVSLHEMKVVWLPMEQSRFGRRIGRLVDYPMRQCEHFHLFYDDSITPPSFREAWVFGPEQSKRSEECLAKCNPKEK